MLPCNLGYGANDSEIQVGISKSESSPTQTAWKDEIEERRSTLMTNIFSDLDSLGKLKREPRAVQAAETSFHALELNTGSDIRQPADCGKWAGQKNARGPEKLEEFLAPSSRRVSESVDFAVATKGRPRIHRKSSSSFHEKEPALYESGDFNLQNQNRSYDPPNKAAGPDAIQADQTEISPKPRIRHTPSILTPRQLCISNLFSLATRWNAGDTQYDDIIHDLEDPECERPLHLTESMEPDAVNPKDTNAQKHSRTPEDAEVTYEELAAALSMEKVKTAKLEEFVNNQYDSLQQQRELSIQQVHETETNYEQRLAAQKEEYEATINKNYKLIDELIAEKQALTQQCSKLVDDMRILKEKAEAKQKLLEDNGASVPQRTWYCYARTVTMTTCTGPWCCGGRHDIQLCYECGINPSFVDDLMFCRGDVSIRAAIALRGIESYIYPT
ncbi:unnamed protein product [Dibothriocephalus latus]|uniref:Uncharacterized protein n=1 Tax=Dibothriocephalus latus TaxID=60516 RepID=A0A3P7L2F2_DIBLA|nr:unnamed protein product [Dibothriocephalus latus]